MSTNLNIQDTENSEIELEDSEDTLKQQLKTIYDDTDNDLVKYVIDEILDAKVYETDEEIEGFFKDLQHGGCQSGFIGSLIYYSDTHKFYDKYYHEIEELRIEMEDNTGETINIGSDDYKNKMAWFAFEETAYNLINQIGLEI